MKIFITGGAGFIGKHLSKLLANQNHQITIFDDFSNSSRDDLKDSEYEKIAIVKGDILNVEDILKNLPGHDIVIHLAAKISVNESIRKPEETFQVNVKGTENILNASIKNNVKRIFAFSSAAIYGNSENKNYTSKENDDTISISPYGESKIRMEKGILKTCKDKKINATIFRLFNVYGKGQTKEYAGVISKFSENIKNKKSITIYGNGEQTRDFIAIEDIVNLIGKMIEIDVGENDEIYNLGTGISTSIKELADIMIEIDGNKISKLFSDQRDGDILHSCASIEKAKNDLGFNPKISLREGLQKMKSHNNL
jgi:UDP-glucose 4-epimerase